MCFNRFKLTFLVLVLCLATGLRAQLVINEACARNLSQVYDEDGENRDWFELYNASNQPVDLKGWSVSDNQSATGKWNFPSLILQPESHLLVFASGKNLKGYIQGGKWESAVRETDNFHYRIPDASTPDNWNALEFNPTSWNTGIPGFGYGDEDDNTLVPQGTIAVYIRKNFTITDTAAIVDAICHVDYDDGFVAYLNGTEICRSQNMYGTPGWDTYAGNQHDAVMFTGGIPEAFRLDMSLLSSILKEGNNVFAVELHNISSGSSDLTLIPFLSFATTGVATYFSPVPAWFSLPFGNNLHTNFKLSSMGETLYLYNEGIIQDTFVVSRQPVDYSLGRITDGNPDLAVFRNSTPGKSNNSSIPYTKGYEPSPFFNKSAGFYSGSVEVSINVGSNSGTIYYTTDGSEPTTSSPRYSGVPIPITKTTVLNARCFSTDSKLPSLVNSATYFINENYTIPVLSVITNSSNLFGATGIFTNNWASWNKPCFVEYFDTLNNLAFRTEAGIQVDGGAGGSRSRPQTSFRIEPGHSVFGADDLNYKLIPDRPERDIYSSFYLRNGSNQYLVLPYKDAVEVRSMGENTHTFYSAYRPVAVHINGEFYGIYELREKINANYLESNYGMDTDSLDLIGVSYFKGMTLQATEGKIDGFLEDTEYFLGLNSTSSTFLDEVGTFLDLDNYTDYIIGQIWIGNTDWPQNNIRAWRCSSTGFRWQFALIDLEWALRPNYWSTSEFDAIQYLKDVGMSQIYSGFWYRLMENEEYKFRFINRFADLMNTSYSIETIGAIEQAYYEEAVVEMPKEFERWGNSNIEAQMSSYTNNHLIFRNELTARSSNVRNHIKNHFNLERTVRIYLDVNDGEGGRIRISSIRPSDYPWNGLYFSDVPITIKAIPNPGYIFNGWDENAYISNPDSQEFTCTLSQGSPRFVANFTPGNIGFEGVTISEINYKDGDNFITTDWFEIFNSTDSELDISDWYFTDKNMLHRYDFNPNTRIPANQRMVVASDTMIFNYLYPEVENKTGGFLFGLGSYSDEIKLYNNYNELIASVKYSNAYPWPLEDNLEGRTIELVNPADDLNDPENWIAGCPGGSPGEAYMKCSGGGTAINKGISSVLTNHVVAYPNPAREMVYLQFFLDEVEYSLQVKLYTLHGNNIQLLEFNNLTVGEHKIPIDLSTLEQGSMYLIRITSENINETIKLIKQ